MVPDGRTDGRNGRTDGQTDGRTDDAKTISLRLRRGITITPWYRGRPRGNSFDYTTNRCEITVYDCILYLYFDPLLDLDRLLDLDLRRRDVLLLLLVFLLLLLLQDKTMTNRSIFYLIKST